MMISDSSVLSYFSRNYFYGLWFSLWWLLLVQCGGFLWMLSTPNGCCCGRSLCRGFLWTWGSPNSGCCGWLFCRGCWKIFFRGGCWWALFNRVSIDLNLLFESAKESGVECDCHVSLTYSSLHNFRTYTWAYDTSTVDDLSTQKVTILNVLMIPLQL